MKRLVTTVSVNFGHWVNFKCGEGGNRGDGRSDCYFQEAAFDFGWLPKNCVGQWVIEMKESNEKDTDLDICLAWQKAVKDAGAGVFTPLAGSEIKLGKYEGYMPDRQRRWELYESGFFPIPDHRGPILLWLLRRHNDKEGILSSAMWTVAFFEEIPDEGNN